jgi:hypothetical protein
MDISDLTHFLDYGGHVRANGELPVPGRGWVRQKAKELGLVEQPAQCVR